jgi:hypothetical protein
MPQPLQYRYYACAKQLFPAMPIAELAGSGNRTRRLKALRSGRGQRDEPIIQCLLSCTRNAPTIFVTTVFRTLLCHDLLRVEPLLRHDQSSFPSHFLTTLGPKKSGQVKPAQSEQ